MRQIQHGDILIREVESIPHEAKPVERRGGRIIVAEGEQTGHHHAITDKGAILMELNGELYLEVTEPVTISHEEHKDLPIPPGKYQVGHVREFDYLAEMERRVAD